MKLGQKRIKLRKAKNLRMKFEKKRDENKKKRVGQLNYSYEQRNEF
jgi:hypothetical protein